MGAQQVDEEAVFDVARQIDSPKLRGDYLQQVCGDNTAMLARVEALLKVHDNQPEFLEGVPSSVLRTVGSPSPTERKGTVIGPYKLREQIGEGGFGVVYVAQQERPVRRTVALKIIKPGMDTKDVVARFEAERQALALMDHPNVARVLDAGATDDGRPFFVMELVHGVPITEFCDKNNLPTRQRLQLFIDICHAVQHAHQKGIIHRDLKPSNIMVTLHDGKPVPKVIDFGVSKALSQQLTEKTIYTSYGQMIGTPVYMSPEQAEMSGLGIDTRSDVYSLGVLLYELLTGKTPLDGKRLLASGYAEMLRIIREDEPPRPSTKVSTLGEAATVIAQHRRTDARKLRQTLSGELDWIVMKALDKDRDRRYDSANNFAFDIERYLSGEAVHACPPSAAYLLRKFVGRHRGPVIAASALLLVLCLGLAGTSFGLIWANREADRARDAETAATRDRDIANNLRLAEAKARAEADTRRLEAVQATTNANEERFRADQRAYISDMNLAAQAWEARDLTRARELLERYVPEDPGPSSPDSRRPNDLRGFEWRLLWGLANDDEGRMTFEVAQVECVALSPEGRHVACGDANGSVNVIDLVTQRRQTILREYSSGIARLAYSNDGRWLAAGCTDGTIQLWEVGSWREKAVLTGHTGYIRDLVFHPDGTQLTSIGTDETIRIWNMTDIGAAQVIENPEPDAERMSISADATTLATSGHLDNTVRFWKLRQDSRPGQYRPLHTLPPQQAIITSITLSANGKKAVISSHDSRVSSWDIATLRPLVTYSQKVVVYNSVLSADGQTLVTGGSDSLVKVWHVESGRELRTLAGPRHQMGLSADARLLVTVGYADTVTVRAISHGEDRNRLLQKGIVVHLAVSPDGQTLATSDPNFKTVKLWDLSTRNSIDFYKGEKTWTAFSPDGKWLALLSREPNAQLMLWDRSTKPYELRSSVDVANTAVGDHLTFSNDSKILAYHDSDLGTIVLWDVATQKILGMLPKHTTGSKSTAFAPDGDVIATGANEQIRLWDVASQRLLAAIKGQDLDIRSLCFSPDGRLLAACSGFSELRWWDVTDPANPRPLPPLRGHTAKIVAVAFSPDGKTLATGGYDGTLRLWDVALKEQTATLRGHSSIINSLTWSPDGNTIFTGSGDASCRIWRAPSWTEIEADEARHTTAGHVP